MRAHLEDMKDMTILDNEMSVNSSLKEGDENLMDSIAESIIESMKK
jgi:hypothetical protein